MRNLDQSILDQKQGLEPIIVIGINWQGQGEMYYGGDASVSDQIYPKILNIPELSQAMNADGSGVSQSITIKLDDSDGTVLNFMNNKDFYLADVNVYQWFRGHPLDLKVKMFEGVIVGPVTYSEAERTVDIPCTTRFSNVQVGFSYDETNVNYLHQSLLGKVWPLTFGTPIHYPALALQEIPSGMILKSFGVPDPSIYWQIAKLNNQEDTANAPYQKLIQNLIDAKSRTGSRIQQTYNDYWIPLLQKEMGQNSSDIDEQISVLTQQYQEQVKSFSTQNSVIGGYKFPQNTPLKCKIGDQLFTCTFLGGGDITNPNQACPVHIVPFYPPGFPSNNKKDSDPASKNYSYNFPENIPGVPSWGLTYPVVKQGFTWISAGSNLTLIDDFDYEFLVSYVPGTVVNVYAYKSYNGLRTLTQVPLRYYKINKTGPVTTITMAKPLSIISYLINQKTTEAEDYLSANSSDFSGYVAAHTVSNTDWEDQIYVTFQSSIGPNIVDILIWLIFYYTPYRFDEDSFDHVKSLLVNYPANFVVMDRPLVDDLMNEICYQSRCSLILHDGVYFLTYLAGFPPAFVELTLDDVAEGSLQVTTTPVEELVTRYTATWRTDYSPDYETPNKVILKNNHLKYGLIDGGHDYFIYNQFYLVQKSAYFWLIRTSNIFKTLKFDCFLDKLNLEVNDAILINFSAPFFASQSVICRITDIGYNPEEYTIALTCWTGVKLGQNQLYYFAYPASLNENDYFYPADTITSGGALGYAPAVIPTPPSFNGIAQTGQTVDYSNWPNDPSDILGFSQAWKGTPNGENANQNISEEAKAQQQLDENSSRVIPAGGGTFEPSNFYGNGAVHVSDIGNPSNSANQLNTNIPYFSPEISTKNPQLTPDFSTPPTDTPTPAPGGSGDSGGGVPGQIVSGGGSDWQVNAFFNGIDGDPTQVDATEVHGDGTLVLDGGTWVTVISVNGSYYLVQPSWAH